MITGFREFIMRGNVIDLPLPEVHLRADGRLIRGANSEGRAEAGPL